MLAPVLLSLQTFLRFRAPALTQDEWTKVDEDLRKEFNEIHGYIGSASNGDDVAKLGDQLNLNLRDFLEASDLPFVKPPPKNSHKTQTHPTTLEEARKLKNFLRRKAFPRKPHSGTKEDRQRFRDAVRTVNFLVRKAKQKDEEQSIRSQEHLYRKNFWQFCGKAVNGTLGEIPQEPAFTKEKADGFYPTTYGVPRLINFNHLDWFPSIPTTRSTEDSQEFNLHPIRPREVREALKKCNKQSAPGADGIGYDILNKLPSLQHILATLYSKVLEFGSPPRSWSESLVKIINKKGDPGDPKNFRMIALSSTVGKLYHLILTKRFADFIDGNFLINKSLQKAFQRGIDGCVEHNLVMSELLKDAKTRRRTLHCSFYDLEDAFGSANHSLIHHTLERNKFPIQIRDYVKQLYGNAKAIVKTKSWQSEIFSFRRGVFQGDPLSPVIFLLIFNPILQHLEANNKHGYELGGKKVITLPFADDFCLLTRNKKKHQRLQDEVNAKIRSMGLKLKPAKCRSYSICGGKPTNVPFSINNEEIHSIQNEEQKYLGRKIFFDGKDNSVYQYVRKMISTKLENLESTLVRGSFKVNIYKRYLKPSLRYFLTVYDLNKTHLQNIDTLCDGYVKKWCGLPKCATNAMLHMQATLDIPTVAFTHLESKATAITNTRVKGDSLVNAALDSKLEREGSWSRKWSAACKAQKTFSQIEHDEDIEGTVKQVVRKSKSKVKKLLREEEEHRLHTHVRSLVKQGSFLQLLQESESDATWKSYIFGLPAYAMKFVLNSCLDTLATRANLFKWGKMTTDKCRRCNSKETTQHILNGCQASLEDGRYTFRHDSVLAYITTCVNTERFKVYCDIKGFNAVGGGTIPPSILVTEKRPDLLIVEDSQKIVWIYELTCPFETRLEEAHRLKAHKYDSLLLDLEDKGYEVHYNAFEVGARGQITKANSERLKDLYGLCDTEHPFKVFTKNISAISVLGSYLIFVSRNAQEWNSQSTEFIKPPFSN